ncbi:MAG: DNA alkylation repair protein [Candidatus Omnitrophica bacterium]|nr:DNA alkylation repair protein [Candidatus Omnitrophota bacterium]
MEKILKDIRHQLKLNSDKKIKDSVGRFFKEKVKVYGLKTSFVRKIDKEYFKTVRALGKDKIFKLCEELWRSGYMEESFIACNWSYYLHNDYEEKDIKIFERWLANYVSNWASCDTLCNHTIGAFVEKYPKFLVNLKNWAKSENRWMRRAAAVTLIVPAKRGKFLNEIFAISDILLRDEDDLVQKGYGWVLKAASQAHEKQVFDYVLKNKSAMPRTALRYAIEKMSKEHKAKAMQK